MHRVGDRVPKTQVNKRGEWARKGPGTLSSYTCNEGRINVLLSHPLVRALSLPLWELVAHSPAYSWDAELCLILILLQGKTRENGQRGLCHYGMGSTLDRRLRVWVTAHWGRYRLGLLSVILDLGWLNVQSGQCDAG